MDIGALWGKKRISQMKQGIEQKTTNETIQYLSQEQLEEKKKKLQNYYVPYDANKMESGFEITVFASNGGKNKQLAIKYYSPEENEKQMIILASGLSRVVNTERAKKQLNKYFSVDLQKLSSLKGIEPERYIEYLFNLGWQVTPEGVDVLSTLRSDGPTEIKRTEFTNEELENISEEDITKNRIRHNLKRERDLIETSATYLKDCYNKVNYGDFQELGLGSLPCKSLFRRQGMVKEFIQNREDNLLTKIFGKIQPVLLSDENPEEEIDYYITTIRSYIKGIPEKYVDKEQDKDIQRYFIIREAIMKGKQKGKELGDEDEDLMRYMQTLDKEKEEKTKVKRQELMQKAEKLINRHRGMDYLSI